MTKDEFIDQYSNNSGYSKEELLRYMVALPCACGEEGCQGWAMVRNDLESIRLHEELYSPEVDD